MRTVPATPLEPRNHTPRPIRLPWLVPALALLLTAGSAGGHPRPPEPLDGGEIAHELRRLQTVGSALYVAAHPDDENTALLSWLTHVKGVRTAYLSMTRGDGGQNLIGQELGPSLGVIRTHELLAARGMDGAEQLFTRALDFGFSKRADETLEFWGRDSVLSDVVWAIRGFRPDIIIVRFPPDSTAGHGHHTASSVLAHEAFAAAADRARFPSQLDAVEPWQAKRLLWNAFSFGRVQVVDSSWIQVDVGAYEPRLGRSMSELAGRSRSNHKSQGFGAAERRGSLPQYLALRAGAPARRDPFEGVDLTWKRFKGGEAVASLFAQAERAFDASHPEALLPLLARAHAAIAKLPPDPLVARKREDLERVMASCAGLWLEAVSARPVVTPGEEVAIATSVLMRTPAAVKLVGVSVNGSERASGRKLEPNQALADTLRSSLAADAEVTQPYWLRSTPGRGLCHVADRSDLGQPENRPALTARFRLEMAGEPVTYELPVAHRWTDAVKGERWRLLEVSPPATLAFEQPFQLFNGGPRAVRVTVRAQRAGLEGAVRLDVPAGWTVQPASVPVSLEREGAERPVEFSVTPGPAGGTASATIEVAGRAWSQGAQRIDYEHVPVQTLFPPAEVKLVRADLAVKAPRVGYLAGSGDQVGDALRQMGCAVTNLSDDDVANGDLARYDAIVAGVRAYNTRPRLRSLQPRLLDWVAKGGTLVVQYVTTSDGPVDYLGPLPMRLGRERVTVEEAPVALLESRHPLLTTPNALGPGDFDGWVQERGLYFAGTWDKGYAALLGSHDPGEPSRDGGLLYAKHGSGAFVYCGYALFRQVPAGVPGAWRLLANLVSAP